MHPILVTILFILPSTTAFVDCRIACRTCRENRVEPTVLEVHCAMCDECKQRRRERMQKRAQELRGLNRQKGAYTRSEDFHEGPRDYHQEQEEFHQPQQPFQGAIKSQQAPQYIPKAYPTGCPTPPPCSDSSEEEPQLYYLNEMMSTTTTPKPTCPPILQCLKKRKKNQTSPMIQYITVQVPQPQTVYSQVQCAASACCCMPMQTGCQCPQNQLINTQPSHAPVSAYKTQPPSTASTKDYLQVYIGIPKEILKGGKT